MKFGLVGVWMQRIMAIYKYVLKHPFYLVFGIFFLFLYAIFSGVSITLVIPLFDNIFITDQSSEPLYLNYTDFSQAIVSMTKSSFVESRSTFVSPKMSLRHLTSTIWSELKIILSLTKPLLLLIMICVMLVIIYFLKNVFYFLNRIMFINLRGKSIQEIRNACYNTYLSQSYSFFNQNRVGDSIVRMINDIENVNTLFIDTFFKIFRETSLVLMYAIIAFSLNSKLFLVSLLVFPPFTIVIKYLSTKMKKYAKKIQAQLSDMFSNIEEVLNNMRIVKAFCKEEYEHQKLVNLNKQYFRFWKKSQVYWSFGVPISEMSTIFIGIAILFMGSTNILEANSDFTFGDFTAFLFAVFSMMHPLKIITNDITDMKKAMISVDRVAEILEMKSEIIEASNPISKDGFADKIEFVDVNFSYNPDVSILKNCNLTINKGQKVAIVGSSGSGKTTLVNLINRMYDVSSGEILIDGINVKKIKVNELRKLFGVVTQESILFTDSIQNNVLYGKNKMSLSFEDDVKRACHFAYADEFIEKLSDSYMTQVLPHGSNFSGGQKQRICIARAIIDNPPILIFDEATSSLDTDSEQKVQKAIDMAINDVKNNLDNNDIDTEKRTVIIIAHRLSTILSADKIVVLDKGEIVGIGKHEEMLENCQKYRHFYELQFKTKAESNNYAIHKEIGNNHVDR